MRGAAAKGAYQAGRKSRVELLPVTWYNGLRVDNSATLRALAAVTPRSVPALRTLRTRWCWTCSSTSSRRIVSSFSARWRRRSRPS